ncbi:MAG TPA: hypothetical protein PKY59_15120 [Pyrinomonadaceae bacterium]|nr:hypothetical protein [Pyrinomonadaceae bacterium]
MLFKRSRFISIFLFVLIIILFNGKNYAQLDPGFGTNGVVNAALGSEDATLASFVLPDGKILVVAVALVNNQQQTFFIKYNSNGTIDNAYGTNGSVQITIPYFVPTLGKIYSAARQPDGKIVIVGYDRSSNYIPLVARYNEDGTLDTTFAGGTGISRPDLTFFGDDKFYSVLIQPDGKILIAGGANLTDSTYPNFCLMRYLPNGVADTSFGGSGTGFIVHTSIKFPSLIGGEFLYLQSDGKIIAGNLGEEDGSPDRKKGALRRYNANGTIDTGFTVSTFPGFNILQSVFVQPDDKILVGTQFSKTDILEIVHTDSRIARYNADGTVDADFGNAGQITLDTASYSGDLPKGFQIMPDGQILVALSVSIQPNRSIYRGNWLALARLSASGTINGKFLVAPTGDNFITNITNLPDGKLLTTVRGRIGITGSDGVNLARMVGVPLQNYLFHAIPFNFTQEATQLGVFRPSTNHFHISPHGELFNIPLAAGDIVATADYISDFKSELAFFRPSTGTWHIVRNVFGSGTNALTVRWGMNGDIPVPADYDGDGKADPAVFRPSDGVWYIYHIADGSYTIVQWGANGDKPVTGDFDGDGRDDIAIWRPSTGDWWILRSSDGGYTAVHFGTTGDIPVQEDYDGDGKFDISVYRPSSSYWYRLNSSDNSFFAFLLGLPGDIPVPGKYDNDPKSNIAVWRPSNGTWYILHPDYTTGISFVFGTNGDIPLPGKY